MTLAKLKELNQKSKILGELVETSPLFTRNRLPVANQDISVNANKQEITSKLLSIEDKLLPTKTLLHNNNNMLTSIDNNIKTDRKSLMQILAERTDSVMLSPLSSNNNSIILSAGSYNIFSGPLSQSGPICKAYWKIANEVGKENEKLLNNVKELIEETEPVITSIEKKVQGLNYFYFGLNDIFGQIFTNVKTVTYTVLGVSVLGVTGLIMLKTGTPVCNIASNLGAISNTFQILRPNIQTLELLREIKYTVNTGKDITLNLHNVVTKTNTLVENSVILVKTVKELVVTSIGSLTVYKIVKTALRSFPK